MHTTNTGGRPFDAAISPFTSNLQPHPGDLTATANPAAMPVSFADLVYATVTGEPNPMQLLSVETHFRDLARMEEGATALRQLRAVCIQHGCYPTLAFCADSVAIPLITAPPTPAVAMSDAYEALRTAVAEVSSLQLRLVAHRYISLLAGTIAQAANPLPAGVCAVPATPAVAGGPVRHTPRLEAVGALHGQVQSYLETQRQADRPLGGIVEQWLGSQDGELAARWNDIDARMCVQGVASPALAFKKFLLGLTYTPVYRLESTRDEVSRWLIAAATPERESLRAEALRICDEATAMCRDNTLLTWNRLKMLMYKDDALGGRYAGRLGELCQLALCMLRWETLESIGQAKILALHNENKMRRANGVPMINVDPVEIMLDYQVHLRQELQLPLSVTEMVFPSFSALVEDDIRTAREIIKQVELDSFYNYLMLDFSPFLAEVQRQIGPDRCQEVENAIYAGLDTLDERVARRLRDSGLLTGNTGADDDARREMGVRVGREIRYNAWLPYANAVLTASSLAPMPAPDMSPPAIPPSR